jgi:type I restriction enzyme R subunit
MDISDCGEKVRQFVQDYIHSNGINAHEPISILDASFKADVESNVKPETKAAQMEHAIKKEISVKLKEDEVFYTSLKDKVEALVEEYKNRQLTIEGLLEELEKVREELVKKAEGKTDSGLTFLQEPYYNKLSEVLEEVDEGKLKILAITLQTFIEEFVSPISDWTKKVDFKRQLTGQIKIKLLQNDLGMEDAAMLAGYFMSLAEIQYGNR